MEVVRRVTMAFHMDPGKKLMLATENHVDNPNFKRGNSHEQWVKPGRLEFFFGDDISYQLYRDFNKPWNKDPY